MSIWEIHLTPKLFFTFALKFTCFFWLLLLFVVFCVCFCDHCCLTCNCVYNSLRHFSRYMYLSVHSLLFQRNNAWPYTFCPASGTQHAWTLTLICAFHPHFLFHRKLQELGFASEVDALHLRYFWQYELVSQCLLPLSGATGNAQHDNNGRARQHE